MIENNKNIVRLCLKLTVIEVNQVLRNRVANKMFWNLLRNNTLILHIYIVRNKNWIWFLMTFTSFNIRIWILCVITRKRISKKKKKRIRIIIVNSLFCRTDTHHSHAIQQSWLWQLRHHQSPTMSRVHATQATLFHSLQTILFLFPTINQNNKKINKRILTPLDVNDCVWRVRL